jgi:hypothetical protein
LTISEKPSMTKTKAWEIRNLLSLFFKSGRFSIAEILSQSIITSFVNVLIFNLFIKKRQAFQHKLWKFAAYKQETFSILCNNSSKVLSSITISSRQNKFLRNQFSQHLLIKHLKIARALHKECNGKINCFQS